MRLRKYKYRRPAIAGLRQEVLWGKIILVITLLLLSPGTFAHSINYALQDAPAKEVVGFYGKLGFAHIIPLGFDHILFVVGLCLPCKKIQLVLWQATAFTVAHSVTLALSMKNIIVAPAAIVEPVIALSIVFIALENLLWTALRAWRVMVVFLFGLVHGMGFAGALNETGLPPGKFFTALVAFNAGVELGQIAVIAAVFGLLVLPLRKKGWYSKVVVHPLSIGIALLAIYWTIERVFF